MKKILALLAFLLVATPALAATTNSTTYCIDPSQAGGIALGSSTCPSKPTINANGLISNGTKFTTSGCSVSATTGGATAGTFTVGANSCTVVVTMNGATGLTAPTGWTCHAEDRTTTTVLLDGATSSTTTTASFTIPVTAGATDVISFGCEGY